MKAAGQTLARPYVVGLVTTLVLGTLTAGGLLGVSWHEAREADQELAAQRAVETLALPAGLTEKVVVDCSQVNVDRCLYSSSTPPEALPHVRRMLSVPPERSDCGTGTRPEATRCGFDTELGGVPVRVMLWPHVGAEMTFEGTDIWIDVRTDADL